MAEFSSRNLCATVEPRARYSTPKCTVRHRMAFPPQFATDPTAFDYDPEAAYTFDHRWSDHAGGSKGGACEKCGKTVKEIRVRINPKTGQLVRRGSLAREIANAARDVPPVRFVGRAGDGNG